MGERGRLPEDLAAMAAGPGLAVVLASVDRSALPGGEVVDLLRARYRLLCHVQAAFLADLAEVLHCPPSPDGGDGAVVRCDRVDEFAPDIVAFALAWTSRAAGWQAGLARDVVERLPAVHAAMLAGTLDVPRARVLTEGVAHLEPDLARRVVEQILPRAGELTTGQLRGSLDRLVLTADPAAARKRRDAKITARGVVRYPDADGTATITAHGLPVERAAAAAERLDALAATARRGGDPRTMDQLRADYLLDLLDGSFTGREPAQRRGVVDLLVPLATVAGVSDGPGEIPGWGPVLADVARRLAHQPQTEWRVNVTDTGGHLVAVTTTGRRPTRTGQNPTRAWRAAARRPTAAQTRHIHSRDRTCRAPGCRRAAARCDIDHTIAWEHGGTTRLGNLGALCRRHHRMKHHPGWHLHQPTPGTFIWQTPHGHEHTRRQQHPDLADTQAG